MFSFATVVAVVMIRLNFILLRLVGQHNQCSQWPKRMALKPLRNYQRTQSPNTFNHIPRGLVGSLRMPPA